MREGDKSITIKVYEQNTNLYVNREIFKRNFLIVYRVTYYRFLNMYANIEGIYTYFDSRS